MKFLDKVKRLEYFQSRASLPFNGLKVPEEWEEYNELIKEVCKGVDETS